MIGDENLDDEYGDQIPLHHLTLHLLAALLCWSAIAGLIWWVWP